MHYQMYKNAECRIGGFGFGNYAKANIIPKIEGRIDVLTIHEIDSAQIHKSYIKNIM